MSGLTGWRAYRLLDVLAVICGVSALVMLVLPASTTVSPAGMRVPATLPAAPPAAMNSATVIDSLRREIVRTNAFSASRREPRARFVAPGSEPMPQPTVPSAFDASGGSFAPPDLESGPRLFGIVSVGGATRALVQLRTSSEPPRLLGVGESFGGVRVVRIAGDRVVISSSSGTRTLRLSRVVPDSSENAP